jgi:hypothetical protein
MSYYHIYSAYRNPRVVITGFNYLIPLGLSDKPSPLTTKRALRQFQLKTARIWDKIDTDAQIFILLHFYKDKLQKGLCLRA